MGEREMFLALFNAITVLAEKLTGERMVVTVANENGDTIKIYGGRSVQWEQITEQSIPLKATVNIDARKIADAVNRHINQSA